MYSIFIFCFTWALEELSEHQPITMEEKQQHVNQYIHLIAGIHLYMYTHDHIKQAIFKTLYAFVPAVASKLWNA